MYKKRIPHTILLVIIIMTFVSSINAAVPNLINYQGRLLQNDGKPVEDGLYGVTFRIYNQVDDLLWEEYQEVTTQGGLFSVIMGSGEEPVTDEILNQEECWLEIELLGEEPLTPKTRLLAVPYAISTQTAEIAQTLQGFSPASFALTTHEHDASHITTGTLNTARYIAYEDLTIEGYLDGVDGFDLLTKSQADALYISGPHTHDAGELVSGTLSVDRYSAWQDLWDEGVITTNPPSMRLLTEAMIDIGYSASNHEHSGFEVIAALSNDGYLDDSDGGDLLRISQANARYAADDHTHSDVAQPVQCKFQISIKDWAGDNDPILYAVIDADATIISYSGWWFNSVTWNSTEKRYHLDPAFIDFHIDSASIHVTPISDKPKIATIGQVGLAVVVYIWEM